MSSEPRPKKSQLPGRDLQLVVGASSDSQQSAVTARIAGGLTDLQLPVNLEKVSKKAALENLAKAINLALQTDFIETPLDLVYRAARVRKGTVEILHKNYIGLGDGIFAKVGRTLKSFRLTLQGPDPASPQGQEMIAMQDGKRPIAGLIDLLGRKLDLLQEFEDMVPMYVEQMIDRLEGTRIVSGWSRNQWEIFTQVIGLDVVLRPVPRESDE